MLRAPGQTGMSTILIIIAGRMAHGQLHAMPPGMLQGSSGSPAAPGVSVHRQAVGIREPQQRCEDPPGFLQLIPVDEPAAVPPKAVQDESFVGSWELLGRRWRCRVGLGVDQGQPHLGRAQALLETGGLGEDVQVYRGFRLDLQH